MESLSALFWSSSGLWYPTTLECSLLKRVSIPINTGMTKWLGFSTARDLQSWLASATSHAFLALLCPLSFTYVKLGQYLSTLSVTSKLIALISYLIMAAANLILEVTIVEGIDTANLIELCQARGSALVDEWRLRRRDFLGHSLYRKLHTRGISWILL